MITKKLTYTIPKYPLLAVVLGAASLGFGDFVKGYVHSKHYGVSASKDGIANSFEVIVKKGELIKTGTEIKATSFKLIPENGNNDDIKTESKKQIELCLYSSKQDIPPALVRDCQIENPGQQAEIIDIPKQWNYEKDLISIQFRFASTQIEVWIKIGDYDMKKFSINFQHHN